MSARAARPGARPRSSSACARFVVGSDTVLPDRVTATTDSDGAFSVALAVPDAGTASYEFTAPAGGSAVFYLEAGAPIDLAVLLAARGVSVSPDAVAVEAGLRAAADAALQALITPSAILAMVKDILVAGDNITITEVDGTLILASTGGGTTYAPSLDFSDVRNSMYIGLTL